MEGVSLGESKMDVGFEDWISAGIRRRRVASSVRRVGCNARRRSNSQSRDASWRSQATLSSESSGKCLREKRPRILLKHDVLEDGDFLAETAAGFGGGQGDSAEIVDGEVEVMSEHVGEVSHQWVCDAR